MPILLISCLQLHRSSLLTSLDNPPDPDAPNVFVINIMDNDKEGLSQWFEHESPTPVASVSYAPLIRARLTAINGNELIPLTGKIDDPETLPT